MKTFTAALVLFLGCFAFAQAGSNPLTDFERAMEHCVHTPRNNANFQAIQRCGPSLTKAGHAAFNLCLNTLNAQARKLIDATTLNCLDHYITAAKNAGITNNKKGRPASPGAGGKRLRPGK